MKKLVLLCGIMCVCGIVNAAALNVPSFGFESGSAGWTGGGDGFGVQTYESGNGLPDAYNGSADVTALGASVAHMNGNSTTWAGIMKTDGTPFIIRVGTYSATVALINRRGIGDFKVPEFAEIRVGAFVDSVFVPIAVKTIQDVDIVVADATAQDFTTTGTVVAGSSLIGKQLCVYVQAANNATPTTYSQLFIDNVRAAYDSSFPGSAINVSPADQAVDVAISNVTLQWLAGTDPNELNPGQPLPGLMGYYVYFGQESDALYQMNATMLPKETTSYNVGALSMDITYYWQIEEAMDNGLGGSYAAGDPNNIVSPIWMFKTPLSTPIITGQPQYTLAGTGQTAVFTVSVESLTTPTFKWYYSTDNANNTAADDVLQSGTTATLSIPGVAQSNEGYYYCVVSNDSLVDVPSLPAFLEFKRLKAWYALESGAGLLTDQVDEVAAYDGTTWGGTRTYVTAKVGNGLSMSGSAAGGITVLPVKDSFTISLWLKTTAANSGTTHWYNGLGIIDSYSGSGTANNYGTAMLGNKFSLGIGGSPTATITSTTAINDGQWHFCVATRDYFTGEMKIYIDGLLEKTGTGTTGTKNVGAYLRVGKLRYGNSYLAGTYDEIKMYNYVLSHEEIAAELFNVTGTPFCMSSVQYDFNGDCVVNMADFSMLAFRWLNCNLYPQAECEN